MYQKNILNMFCGPLGISHIIFISRKISFGFFWVNINKDQKDIKV